MKIIIIIALLHAHNHHQTVEPTGCFATLVNGVGVVCHRKHR